MCSWLIGKDKGGGVLFYSFIYKSDTPSTIATHRSICTDCETSFLIYIKICADTFDNHINIYNYIMYLLYGGRITIRESRGRVNWRMSLSKYSSSPSSELEG